MEHRKTKRSSSFSLKKSKSKKQQVQKTRKILLELDPGLVPSVPYQNQIILARICDVYDGDTCTFIVLLGDKIPVKLHARIMGIDTPELRGGSALEKDAGLAVRDEVMRLINDKVVLIKMLKWDKYGGRVDAQLYIEGEEEGTLAEYLLNKGLAKPYDGGKKEEWQPEELLYILDTLNKNDRLL